MGKILEANSSFRVKKADAKEKPNILFTKFSTKLKKQIGICNNI